MNEMHSIRIKKNMSLSQIEKMLTSISEVVGANYEVVKVEVHSQLTHVYYYLEFKEEEA